MTSNDPVTAARPLTRRRWVRSLAIVAAAVVPLAFAGLAMAALSDTQNGVDRIPAAIVNQDEMVTQTAADGTETPVLAGRLLVTELTGKDSPGMDWQLSNAQEAADKLAAGEVYAVLTIPSDFSTSVVSLSSTHPVQAQLTLETDDAHSYLAGAVAQSLGDGMVRAFGSQLTTQYIAGIYTQFGSVGEAFTQAADGAAQLSDGAAQAASGAQQYADGVGQYTSGVSSLSAGLATMKKQTASLGQLGSGIQAYTGGVSSVAGGLDQFVTAMAQDPRFTSDPTLAPYLSQLQGISAGLGQAAAQGPALASGASGLGALASGIGQTADGASRLAANGSTITSGAQALADGNAQLATGASDLAAGLQQGADKMSGSETPGADAASVAAEPVGLKVSTENAVGQLGQVIGTYFVPLGLWVGALAIFLVLPRLSRRVLASTAGSGRVLGSEAVRAGGVAALQALLLVLLLHLVAGVSWALLPATFGLSLVAALAFTAFHQLLTVGLGRTGLVISLLLLGVQLASVGGILPSQALAAPFAWISSVSPLGWASTGLQQIVAGGSAGVAIGSAAALAAFGLVSALASRLVIRRARRASVLRMLLPATA
ncbi:MAG: YhgE/Pip family protein [Protaetiibacter sp.]